MGRVLPKQSEKLGCTECRTDAAEVADSIETVIVKEPQTSIRRVRNQVCHGGPIPKNIDRAVLYGAVSLMLSRIVRIYEHGHVPE
ncbi:hypothetical protein SVIOM342S_01675 [Streptomyces violaceorubidus]